MIYWLRVLAFHVFLLICSRENYRGFYLGYPVNEDKFSVLLEQFILLVTICFLKVGIRLTISKCL